LSEQCKVALGYEKPVKKQMATHNIYNKSPDSATKPSLSISINMEQKHVTVVLRAHVFGFDLIRSSDIRMVLIKKCEAMQQQTDIQR
jgi:hypothetical protein